MDIEMHVVRKKFEEFKEFVTGIPGIDKFYLEAIKNCTADLFLVGLKGELDKKVDELMKQISSKANINFEAVKEEIKMKFVAYLEYFMGVSRILVVKLK